MEVVHPVGREGPRLDPSLDVPLAALPQGPARMRAARLLVGSSGEARATEPRGPATSSPTSITPARPTGPRLG
jgi:hypothetical protein